MANFLTRHFNFLSNKDQWAEFEAIYGTFAEKAAFKQLAVYIATSYLANALSGCEFKVIKGGEEVKDMLYYRLNVSPNPNQSAAQFKNELVTRICTRSESLVVPHRENSLYIADAYAEYPRALKDNLFMGITVENQAIGKKFPASDAYFFKLESRQVANLINGLYEDYSKLISAAIQGFMQGHGRKYKLKLSSTKAGDTDFAEQYEKVVKKQLENFLKSENAVYPEYQGYDLEELKHEADSSSGDILAMRKEVFDLVAQAYKIPTSMMYGNTNNTKDVLNQFLTFAIDPIAKLIEDEITRKSFTYMEWQTGSRVLVDTKSINHVDLFNVAADVDKLISSGVLCIDDVLIALGYQPLNTEFSKAHFMTKNYELAEDAMKSLSEGGEN